MATSPSTVRRLTSLACGEAGMVDHLETSAAVQYKLMELGVWPGETIKLVRKAPWGDPLIVELMGYQLALRLSEADHIFLK